MNFTFIGFYGHYNHIFSLLEYLLEWSIIGHHNLAFSVLKYIFMGVEEIFRDLTHIYFVRIDQTLGPDPLTLGS